MRLPWRNSNNASPIWKRSSGNCRRTRSGSAAAGDGSTAMRAIRPVRRHRPRAHSGRAVGQCGPAPFVAAGPGTPVGGEAVPYFGGFAGWNDGFYM